MNTTTDAQLITTAHDGITYIRLNRPASLNALSFDLIKALDSALDDLLYDYSQRVVILEGAGRAFCAGIDLYDVTQGKRWVNGVGKTQATYALQEAVGRLIIKLRKLPQPVIAVVQGLAVGGGLSLACAADFRIGEPEARFDPAFVRLGASGGDMGSSWLLPRIIGFNTASEVLLTGRQISATEARSLGLLTQLVEPGMGLQAAQELAQRIGSLAPFSTRMTKSLLNLSRDGLTLEQVIELENRSQVLMTATDDFQEATQAFVERRPAQFRDQ